MKKVLNHPNMADSDIKKALLTAAKTFLEAQGFTGAIHWENRVFDPSGLQKWASIFHIPNQPSVVTLGTGGLDRETGFLQIDFNIPQNTGDGALNTWADAARGEFIAGKSYTFSGQTIIILNTGIGAGRNVDSWFRKSLTINYRADLTRAII